MKIPTTIFFLFALTTGLQAAPDPQDSIIIESKTVAPQSGACASAILKARVFITNKDSLANITLPLEEETIAGSSYGILSRPANCGARTNSAVFDVLLPAGQLPTRVANFNNYHSSPPDTFMWTGTYAPGDDASKVPPHSTRVPLLDVKFDSIQGGSGQFSLDSSLVPPGSTIQFIASDGGKIEVNFLPGNFSTACTPPPTPALNCPSNPANLLFGRPFSFDFNATGGNPFFSLTSGPGTIHPTTGVYNFSGRCSLGSIPVTIRAIDSIAPNCKSGAALCSFTINVFDNPPSCAPGQATLTVSHGALATNPTNPSDPDAGDVLTVVQLSGPGTTNSSPPQAGWSYQTSCADVAASPQIIRVKVADGFGSCQPGPLADTCQFQLVVTNSPPSITNCPPGAVSAPPNVLFSLQLNGADTDPADAGNLIFSRISGPVGLTVSPSGLVQWTPAPAQTGVFSACIDVTDLCGAATRCCLNFNGIKGDLNLDGILNPVDVILMLNCAFLGAPPPAGVGLCDVNCDGISTAADVVTMLNAIFLGTPFPC